MSRILRTRRRVGDGNDRDYRFPVLFPMAQDNGARAIFASLLLTLRMLRVP